MPAAAPDPQDQHLRFHRAACTPFASDLLKSPIVIKKECASLKNIVDVTFKQATR